MSLCLLSAFGSPPQEEHDGLPISEMNITADGPVSGVSPQDLSKLVLLKEGEVFTVGKARETISLLYQTGLFYDVQISTQPSASGGVGVQIKLIRLHQVEKVSFRGKLGVKQQILRRELALREEEAFSSEGLEETIRRLRELYPRQGYYKADIEASTQVAFDKARVSIIFDITAGQRAQIRDLTMELEGPVALGELLTKIKSRIGSDYSGVQLEEDIASLRSYLSLRGFLRPEIETVGDPDYDEMTNTVALHLLVRPGALTEIDFEGVDLTSSQLEVLPIYRLRNTGTPILEETVRELKTLLQEQGYFLVEVEFTRQETPSDAVKVVFTVSKGRQYKLDEVRIEGNSSIDSERLLVRSASKEGGTFSRGLFTDKTIELDQDAILASYARNGYLDAIVTYELKAREDKMTLVYRISEGPRYIVRSLAFSGNEEIPTDQFEEFLTMREDQTFSSSGVSEDRATLLALYQDRGFKDATIATELTYDNRGFVDLVYAISEGSRYYVDEVVVVGTERTRRETVENQIVTRKDEPLSLRRNLQSETSLYDLGVFKSVRFDELPSLSSPNRRTVLFRVEEGSKYSISYGVGYNYSYGPSASEGFRGTFGLTNNNFLGRAYTLSFGVRGSTLRQRGNVALSMPRLFKIKLPTVLSATVSNENRIQTEDGFITIKGRPYDSLRFSVSSQSEKVLSRRESLFYRYEFASVQNTFPEDEDFPPEQFFREEERLRLSSVGASYVNESRDEPLDPKEGFFLSGDTKLTLKILGSERQFLRFLGQGRYYHPITDSLVFASSLRLGIILPFRNTVDDGQPEDPCEENPDNDVPISERFFAGGPTTIRGLPLDLAGPLLYGEDDEGVCKPVLVNTGGENLAAVPLGGNVLSVLNLEMRFPIFFLFGGNFFYDVGNVFASPTKISLSEMSHDFGFGLSIRTPIGPFRIDAAYNPDPPDVTGYSRWNFHINFGHPF